MFSEGVLEGEGRWWQGRVCRHVLELVRLTDLVSSDSASESLSITIQGPSPP